MAVVEATLDAVEVTMPDETSVWTEFPEGIA
jgi:hypothetical protein